MQATHDVDETKDKEEHLCTALETPEHKEARKLMQAMAIVLKMPHQALLTAMAYLLRFSRISSFGEVDDYFWAVTTCIFLATKVEEAPCRISDILNAMHRLRNPWDASPLPRPISNILEGQILASNEKQSDCGVLVADLYYRAKEQLLKHEQTLLRALGFQISVLHPHKYLLNYCNTMKCSRALAQLSWAVLNDSVLNSSLTLRHPPAVLAAAALNFGALLLEVTSDLPNKWWELLGIEMSLLEAVGSEMLDLHQELSKKQEEQ